MDSTVQRLGGSGVLGNSDSSEEKGSTNNNSKINDDKDEMSNLTGSDLEEDVTWIEWFCGLKGNDMFVFVDEEFVRDDFNLTGLSTQVPYYEKALSLIVEGDLSDDSPSDSVSFAYIEKSAALLFGLIHARFILTTKGLDLLQQKVASHFYSGGCPNALCDFKFLVPCALTDTPNMHTVKLFCARCNELYHPPRASFLNNIDGAFFGTSVASLFFMAYPQMLPVTPKAPQVVGVSQLRSNVELAQEKSDKTSQDGSSKDGADPVYYIPKIFGFKVHPNSRKLILEKEEENMRLQMALAGDNAAAPGAAAIQQQQQQQQHDSDKWYVPGKPSPQGGAPTANFAGGETKK